MHRRDFLSATAATAAALHLPPHLLAAPVEKPLPIEYIDPDPATGSSKAVVVGPGVSLLHMNQTEWLYESGVIPDYDVEMHVTAILDSWDRHFRNAQIGVANLIKLNLVLRKDEDAIGVRKLLAKRFSGMAKPAVSYVVGATYDDDRILAMIDGVVACTNPSEFIYSGSGRSENGEYGKFLPPGPKVYVSGQAEKGSNLSTATRLTMNSLRKSLAWLSLDLSRAVQIKSFVTPVSQVPAVADEMGIHHREPMSFVEWKSALPIEIELVASAAGMKPPSESVGPIEFLTPPGMTASPVFSRVTRVWSDRTIYTSGLHGREGQDAEGQIRDIFAQLEDVLKKAGSDLRHMAKATYYVSTEEASAKLNAIRPEFYDPQRPPAASKAMVAGVGMPGRSVTLDMIAVPKA